MRRIRTGYEKTLVNHERLAMTLGFVIGVLATTAIALLLSIIM